MDNKYKYKSKNAHKYRFLRLIYQIGSYLHFRMKCFVNNQDKLRLKWLILRDKISIGMIRF